MGSTVDRALALWEHFARTRAQGPLTVAAVPDSRLCPPGWCGVIHLGGATLATAPTVELANVLRAALAKADHATPDDLRATLAVTDTLGPATLAYLTASDFRPLPAPGVARLPAQDAAIQALLEKAGPEEAGESGLAELELPLFALIKDAQVIAAAGYKVLPQGVAHLSALTHPAHRGRGLAGTVASAAVADALAENLLPQWRARPAPSRRVASRLGFQELGTQFALHLT